MYDEFIKFLPSQLLYRFENLKKPIDVMATVSGGKLARKILYRAI